LRCTHFRANRRAVQRHLSFAQAAWWQQLVLGYLRSNIRVGFFNLHLEVERDWLIYKDPLSPCGTGRKAAMVLCTADGMLQLERPKATLGIQERIMEEQITAKNQMRVLNPDLFYFVSTEKTTSEDPTTK
jgi:hypothetical protein